MPRRAAQRSAEPHFGLSIVVDWSAAASPTTGADSIWIAACEHASGRIVHLSNPPTRHVAARQLRELCTQQSHGRVLLGADFPMGPPCGTTDRLARADGQLPWARMWSLLADLIDDDERNRNNRWAVAAELNRRLGALLYWGAPHARATKWLASTKTRPTPFATACDDETGGGSLSGGDNRGLAEFRIVERQLRRAGSRPFSWWQLLGAGSVGSQIMTGVPVLHGLRHDAAVGQRVTVWPFETGLTIDWPTLPSDAVVIAEVWPSMLARHEIDAVDHPVKDARQVTALAQRIAGADRDGELTRWFAPALDETTTIAVLQEEGWVLGVGADGRPLTVD